MSFPNSSFPSYEAVSSQHNPGVTSFFICTMVLPFNVWYQDVITSWMGIFPLRQSDIHIWSDSWGCTLMELLVHKALLSTGWIHMQITLFLFLRNLTLLEWRLNICISLNQISSPPICKVLLQKRDRMEHQWHVSIWLFVFVVKCQMSYWSFVPSHTIYQS